VCWAAGLLAALLVIFFSTPILRREVLSPADLLLKSEPWRSSAAPDFEAANALLSDVVFQMRPWRAVAIASLKAGHVPLWDPYNYTGAPLLGNGTAGVLNPLYAPDLLLPGGAATLLGAMLRLFIAGLSAYLFGRFIGLSTPAAALTGVGFAFSGFLVVWLLYSIGGNIAIWLPGLFLATEALVRRPTVFRMLAVAAIVWIQFLGGHPGTSLHILSGATFYLCWRAAMFLKEEGDRRRLMRRLATFTAAMVLGTAAAAAQLIPLGEYIILSATLGERLAAPTWGFFLRPRLLAMIALACPYCFGSHLRGDLPLGIFLGVGNFNELNGGYVGLASLVLAGIAITLGARRGTDLFFIVLGGLAFCVAFTIPPVVNVLHALPVFRASSPQRMLLLLAFAVCVLAGRGMDLLLAAPEAQARRIARRVWAILLAAMVSVAIVAGGCLLIAMSFRERILDEARARIVSKAGKETFRQSPEHYLALLPRYYDRLVQLLIREGTGRVVLLALTGLAIGLAVKSATGRRPSAWLLPGALIIDLFSFGRNYNPSIPPELDYPSHGAIEFLQRQPGPFRILALDGALPPNTNAAYGLHEVRGYNVLDTVQYRRFLDATGTFSQPHRHFRSLYFSNFESRLVDLLNVTHIISARELRHPKLNLVWEDGARVYENRSALPRAFLVYRTRVLRSREEMDHALGDPEFDPSAVALLDGEGPDLSGPPDPAPAVRIADYQPERVVIEVSTRYDGVLILADAWYPGWEASVDGTSTKILRGDLLLRAIPVPAGRHQVIFRYRPTSFRVGLMVSGASFIIAISLVLARVMFRRRHGERLS
jgi:hypothetical protein